MTAEIAVLNKSAVALAADSAVTVSRGDHHKKTYNVNKLFTLSKYHPIGVMIFDSAELMGVPMETIIKLYRRELGTRSFDTVREYADDFIRYVGSDRTILCHAAQRNILREALVAGFTQIRNDAAKKIKELTLNGKRIPKTKIRDVYEAEIERRHSWIMDSKRVENIDDSFVDSLTKASTDQINKSIKAIFDAVGVSKSAKGKLRTIAIEMLARGKNPFGKTGIVIAGFGNQEILPVVETFVAHGVFHDRLFIRRDDEKSYKPPEEFGSVFLDYAAVLPFAQTDVVQTFVNGVDPEFLKVVFQQIFELLSKYPELVAEKAGITDNLGKETLKANLEKHNEEALGHIRDEFLKRIRETHQKPLLEIVATLPKDELANIASALVELTSAKRKMSPGVETVGGPIDVAVISKGDGFVWISRKHYFRPELNVRFSTGYFRENGHVDDQFDEAEEQQERRRRKTVQLRGIRERIRAKPSS